MRGELLVAMAFLLLTASATRGQNLVVNGDFDEDFADWTIVGDIGGSGTAGDPNSVSYRPDIDGLGDPDSGSVQFNSPSEFTQLGQCAEIALPLTSLTDGVLFQGDANAHAFLSFYSDTDCQVLIAANGGFVTSDPVEDFQCRINTWPLATHIPLDTRSVFFSFGRDTGTDVQNLFDNAFLIRGLPEDFPPHTGQAELLEVTGLTVRVRGTTEGGISPFERRFRWEFVEAGGGVPVIVEGQEVEHTFPSPGTYHIFMQADSGCDGSVNDMLEVTVTGSATEIPTISSVGLVVFTAVLGLVGLLLLRRRGLLLGS